jgi:2-phosphosulfolactate phosphatase
MTISLDVALMPALAGPTENKVCIVVDVLRASSTLAVMFAQDVEEVVIAPSVDDARRLTRDLGPSYLLCGEVNGLPPEGFDYGNSPGEFSRLSLAGKRAILATTNGGKLLASLRDASHVLVSSIVNASAVAQTVCELTHSEGDIIIVCAGERGGLGFSLADAIGAGSIVDAMAESGGLALSDGATAALTLYRAHKDALEDALRNSTHGRGLVKLGLADDVRLCAQKDVYHVVPQLAVTTAGYQVLRVAR